MEQPSYEIVSSIIYIQTLFLSLVSSLNISFVSHSHFIRVFCRLKGKKTGGIKVLYSLATRNILPPNGKKFVSYVLIIRTELSSKRACFDKFTFV